LPVTPFHFGIGALAKGALPEQVSLTAFVASQVVIDCETAFYLIRHDWPVHRWLHTFAVGTPVGLLTGVVIWMSAPFLPRLWRRLGVRPAPAEVALVPSFVGGFLGGVTHPLLDGIMHWDTKPFRPFLESNPLLDSVGLVWLHLLCILLGLVGLGLLFARRKRTALYLVNGPAR
jgi:hypothetical protein